MSQTQKPSILSLSMEHLGGPSSINNNRETIMAYISSTTPDKESKSVLTKNVLTEYQYPQVFSQNLKEAAANTSQVQHFIKVIPDTEPHAQKPFRTSPLELDHLRTSLEDLLEIGFIRPSNSP